MVVEVDLIRGKPAMEVAFQPSLAGSVIHTISMLLTGSHVEGLDQWVYSTGASLPDDLKADMELVVILTQKRTRLMQWIIRHAPDDAIHHDFSAFISQVDKLTENDLSDMIRHSLGYFCSLPEEEPAPLASKDDVEELRTTLTDKLDASHADRAIQLALNPMEFKALFISVLTRYWEKYYRQEYQRSVAIMDRSVAYHSRQSYTGDLLSIIAAVTGRHLDQSKAKYTYAERVIFMPSCHIGPYLVKELVKTPQPTVIVHYNCRTTGTPEGDDIPAVLDLFPPIKALADETRLQILAMLNGREMYAQEIVERLDISQSAVSRHLKLMVLGGLLTVRKEDSMKFFSINEETLAVVAEKLSSFRTKGA